MCGIVVLVHVGQRGGIETLQPDEHADAAGIAHPAHELTVGDDVEGDRAIPAQPERLERGSSLARLTRTFGIDFQAGTPAEGP